MYIEFMQFHPNDLRELDELTEEHLGFSALSDGLGFSKNSQPTAQDIPGAKTRFSVPTSDDRPPVSAKQTVGPSDPSKHIAPTQSKVVSATKPQSAASTGKTSTNVLTEPAASQTIRLAAFFLDCALVAIPLALAWAFSFGRDAWSIFMADLLPPAGLLFLSTCVYFLLSESFGGQSIAKMILNLRVVEDDKYQKPTGFSHALARVLLFIAGTALLGLGLWASFWDAKKRPWHDRYTRSIVRRTV